MTTPSVEQIRQAVDRLQTEVALSRDIGMNQNEQFADDIALVCASLTEAQGEIARLKVELQEACSQLKWAGDQDRAPAAMREERDRLETANDVLSLARQSIYRNNVELADAVAHLTEERDVMQAKLRGLPPTVAAGLIQRLQDENAALTEEREGLKADVKLLNQLREADQETLWRAIARMNNAEIAHALTQETAAELLARIFRDGGQRQGDFPSLEAAVTAADLVVANVYAELASLTAAHERLREALTQIAERDHVRDPNDRPPLVVALERWHDCVALAKAALTSPEGPPMGAVVKGTPLTKGQWQVEVDDHGHVTSLRHLHDDDEPSRGTPYPNSSKAGTL